MNPSVIGCGAPSCGGGRAGTSLRVDGRWAQPAVDEHVRQRAQSDTQLYTLTLLRTPTLNRDPEPSCEIVPAGLNAIMLRFERNMATLYAALAREDTASGADLGYMVSKYLEAKERRKAAMHTFLYWPEGAQWRDYHVTLGKPVSWAGTTAAAWLPLWAGCLPAGSEEIERVILLEENGLLRPAGCSPPPSPASSGTRRTRGRCSTC